MTFQPIQEGLRSSRIVAVGESPGKNEWEKKRPFIGGSGVLWAETFEPAGLSRSDFFITNLCHIRPPDDVFEWFLRSENQIHLMRGILLLKKDLEEIKPNIVVALGAHPLRILTGKEGIDKWRGSILESTLIPGLKVVGSYHPAYCLRNYDYKAILTMDMIRVAQQSQFPEIIRPQREYILDPDKATRRVVAEEMKRAEWLSIDIETHPGPQAGFPELTCVGFSDRPDRAMTVHIRTADDINFVREMCACPAKKIFQNGPYDTTVFTQHGIPVVNYDWDTMYAHHSLYTECASSEDEVSKLTRKGKKPQQAAIRKGLAFQTSIYTEEPYYKDDGKTWHETGDLKQFWLYNARDAAVTREIRDEQAKLIAEFGVSEVFAHEMSLIEPTMSMTRHGLLVDQAAHRELMHQYTTEVNNLQKFLEATAGDLANAKSPKQMQALLYDRLGLPKQYKQRKGKEEATLTADKDAINKLAEKYPHPVLLTILEIRERRDIIERYLNTAYGTDGFMRCSFDPTGTRTGRLASRASLDETGTNMQNQPPEIRRMYIARPGNVFVYRDYSQAEARVVAYLAREDRLIELFEDPTRDIHTENASRIFGIPVANVSPEQRYNAKRGVHAFNYGMEDDKFVKVVNQAYRDTGFRMNHSLARKIREGYFLLYPGIKANFWREVERELRETRTLTSFAVGRKRMFFGRMDDKLIRDAYSYKPQSTVGDLCCKALVRCYHEIERGRPELNARLLLNVHDSLLMECPIQHALEVSYLMGECMDMPLTIHGRTFKIPTDSKIGYNWGELSDKNPRGLIKEKNWKEVA